MNIKIDPALKALIPPLEDAEIEALTQSIKAEGCRDPLVVWMPAGILVDGHNRYAICTRLGLPFEVVGKEFADRFEAIDWMCLNQLGRRNLSEIAKADLRGKLYNNEKQARGGIRVTSSQSENLNERTVERIAKATNVGHATISRDGKLSASLDKLQEIGVDRQEITIGKRKIRKNDVVELAQLAEENPEAARRAWAKVTCQGPKSGAIKAAIREVKNEDAAVIIDRNQDDLVEIHHGDFAALTMLLDDNSIDAIITDPPYPAEYLHTWSSLGEVAMRVLKPGGWCIAYSGKQHLDEVMRRMTSAGLSFYWQIIFKQTVTATIHGRKVNTTYKPILLFQKPPIKKPDGYFMDIIYGKGMEKDGHEWQQSEDGFEWLINQFTRVGDRILEPFSGSGTCPAVAKQLHRFCVAYEIDDLAYAASCRRVFGDEAT